MIPLRMNKNGVREDLLTAHLAAAAIAAHVLEAALPGPGPWFKVGLANTFTLVALFHIGWRAALVVSLIRVLAGSMALGTFLSPTFFLSLSGALAAVGVMGVARLMPLRFGPVGVSLLAALAHMSAQVSTAYLLIIGHAGLFLALPWFLAGSWVTGILNGLIAFLILERLTPDNTLPGGQHA